MGHFGLHGVMEERRRGGWGVKGDSWKKKMRCETMGRG